MSKVHSVLIGIGLAAALLAGCGDTGPKPVAQKEVRNAPPPPPPAPTPPAPTAPQAKPEPVRIEAQPGVGEKRGGGLYPADTYFKMRETIVFQNVAHCLDLYKAEHDNKGPKTHEEFMEKVIKANQIHLPDLLPNERYVYDPQQEKLMVEVQPQ